MNHKKHLKRHYTFNKRLLLHSDFPSCINESKVHSSTTQQCVDYSNTINITINITIVDDLGNKKIFNNYSATKTVVASAEAANNIDFFLNVGDILNADCLIL